MPDIGERAFELAKDASSEQERHVSDLRTRGVGLLGAGGVVAGLLGESLFRASHPDGGIEWLFLGLASLSAVVLIVATVALLAPRRLAFSVDARAAYEEVFVAGLTEQPLLDLQLAETLVTYRAQNEDAVATLRTAFRCCLGGFVALTSFLAAGAALTS